MRIARKRFRPEQQKIKVRINQMIKAPEVRVIDENGDHVGTMSIESAFYLANEKELDIVEINPNSNPPVVKIVEYGQFKYQMDKEEKLQKKKQKDSEVKGVRISLRIGEHDRRMRVDQAKNFLADGNKVKVELILRGREKAFITNAFDVMNSFVKELHAESPLIVEQPVSKQGNKITALLTSS